MWEHFDAHPSTNVKQNRSKRWCKVLYAFSPGWLLLCLSVPSCVCLSAYLSICLFTCLLSVGLALVRCVDASPLDTNQLNAHPLNACPLDVCSLDACPLNVNHQDACPDPYPHSPPLTSSHTRTEGYHPALVLPISGRSWLRSLA